MPATPIPQAEAYLSLYMSENTVGISGAKVRDALEAVAGAVKLLDAAYRHAAHMLPLAGTVDPLWPCVTDLFDDLPAEAVELVRAYCAAPAMERRAA